MTRGQYSPYFDQEEPIAEIEGLIADEDTSQPYELDSTAVFKVKGKGWLVVTVSGCSCWPDRGWTDQQFRTRKSDVDKLISPSLRDELQNRGWKVTEKAKA